MLACSGEAINWAEANQNERLTTPSNRDQVSSRMPACSPAEMASTFPRLLRDCRLLNLLS